MLLVKILAKNIDMELPITLEEFFSHTINIFSRSYHEYMSVWMPQIGDYSLFCWRKLSNEYHEYAAAMVAKFLHLPGWYASCKVTGTRINRGIGVGLEIPIEITFVGKETATEWLKIALHRINMIIKEKVLRCKK